MARSKRLVNPPILPAGAALALAALLGLAACGGGGSSSTSGGGGAADFSLSLGSASLSLAEGANGSVPVSIQPQGGFNGAVTLSAGGLPAGATASFTPNPATGSASLALALGSNVPPGNYTVTVTGVSGTLQHTGNLSLTVLATAALGYGVDVNLYDSNIGPQNAAGVFSLIQGTGAKYVRVGLGGWAGAEPNQPPNNGRQPASFFSFSGLNQLLSAAQQDGLQVLLNVGDNVPSWDLPAGANTQGRLVTYAPADCTGAANGNGSISGETDCAYFGAYIYALVQDVAPIGVKYLIVWNEPQNFPKNWIASNNETVDQNAAAFATLLHVAYVNAHAADPNIRILNGGTEILPAGLQQIREQYVQDPALAQQEGQFVNDLYASPDFCDSMDVLDVHVDYHGPVWSPEIVDDSEQTIEQCDGDKWLPVWVTESGYSSIQAVQSYIPASCPTQPNNQCPGEPETEAELGPGYLNGAGSQAQFLTNTWGALAKDANVVGMDWTFIVDPTYNGNPAQDGAGAGLVEQNWNTNPPPLKPSYTAMQQITGYP